MVKVFVSQPMRGRSQGEIESERDAILAKVRAMYAERGEDVREVPSYFGPKGESQMEPLECLGKSLELMSRADVAVFAPGWEKARGCRIEHMCASEYGVEICEMM